MSQFISLLIPTKNHPLLFCGGLKSTGNNLCPGLLVTLSSYDGDMLLWMRFFRAGRQKIRVAGFIASFKDTSVFLSSDLVSSIRRQMVLLFLVTSYSVLCFST